jgi:signal transduction histidine kinase
MAADRFFAEVVSLACHDLRTPLATVHGFARTIERLEPEDERAGRYVGFIVEGSEQLAGLLERLALLARIERGTYEPPRRSADSLELARAAASRVSAGEVSVSGEGVEIDIDPDPTERSVADFLTCALRHGDADQLQCTVRGPELQIEPVSDGVGQILLGEDLRDFGAVTARIHVEAMGGSARVDRDSLLVELPT